MQKLFGIFMIYLFTNFIYYLVVGYNTIDYLVWNQITNMFVLISHLLMIFSSILVTRTEFNNANQRFFIRLVVGLGYLVLLYVFIENQIYLLK